MVHNLGKRLLNILFPDIHFFQRFGFKPAAAAQVSVREPVKIGTVVHFK
jgi:predicted N-acetyltransferase YhbS